MVECDATECNFNVNGHCSKIGLNPGLKIKNGQCVSGSINMDRLHERWRWAPGVELVKQRPNQSEYSRSMVDKKNEEHFNA
jgi:hypothetical protein